MQLKGKRGTPQLRAQVMLARIGNEVHEIDQSLSHLILVFWRDHIVALELSMGNGTAQSINYCVQVLRLGASPLHGWSSKLNTEHLLEPNGKWAFLKSN